MFPPAIQISNGARSWKTSRWNTTTGLFSRFDTKVAEYRETTYLVITAYAPDTYGWWQRMTFVPVFYQGIPDLNVELLMWYIYVDAPWYIQYHIIDTCICKLAWKQILKRQLK